MVKLLKRIRNYLQPDLATQYVQDKIRTGNLTFHQGLTQQAFISGLFEAASREEGQQTPFGAPWSQFAHAGIGSRLRIVEVETVPRGDERELIDNKKAGILLNARQEFMRVVARKTMVYVVHHKDTGRITLEGDSQEFVAGFLQRHAIATVTPETLSL